MSRNLIGGRYEVYKHIGQGGMADVFLAVDTILNRQVAVKIMRGDLSTDTVSIIRFEREAQAATALSHPNIVEIYDMGDYKGHQYIVMEYVPGKTLKKVIQDRGALQPKEAVDIMKQLTSAVGEAHHKGIIHRDLKPQNIILKDDGTVKILDFGIALAKGNAQITQANNVMGSVHYLAPELAKGEPASAQSDIYALGIVFYEMLVGDVPFKAETAVQVALMQMRNDIPDVRSYNPAIPQSVENIINKATAKDPLMRYNKCYEMFNDLRTCLRADRVNEEKLILSPKHDKNSSGFDTQATDINDRKTKQKNAVERPGRRIHPERILLGILLTCLLVGGGYFVLQGLEIFRPQSRMTEVPAITGMTLQEARDVCTESSLVLDTATVEYVLTDNTEKGMIITVDPPVGTEVEKGSRVSVMVSSGIGATIGNYVGWNVMDARSDLSKYAMLDVETTHEDTEEAEGGIIIRQELLNPGDRFNIANKAKIRLVYASYPTIVIPESIIGMPIDDASALLESLGAVVFISSLSTEGLSETEIANLPSGVVIKTNPDTGNSYTQEEENFVTIFYYNY